MTDVAKLDGAMPLCFAPAKFGALGDSYFLRDPAGRSPRPRLRTGMGGEAIEAHGAFLLHHDYAITRHDGARFVDVTGDPNPIHREGNVVAGAMTLSKMLLPLEVVLPTAQVLSVQTKFTSVAFYGDRIRNVFRFEPDKDGVWKVEVNTYQAGRRVAKSALKCQATASAATPAKVRERRVNKGQAAKVAEFCDALGVEFEGYVDQAWGRNYTYPLSFLASLPSGAIVEQMSGQGGLLNALTLDFEGMPRVPMVGRAAPTVQLEQRKQRRSFNKIIANIVQGIVTYCKGHAIVHPDADLALAQLGGE